MATVRNERTHALRNTDSIAYHPGDSAHLQELLFVMHPISGPYPLICPYRILNSKNTTGGRFGEFAQEGQVAATLGGTSGLSPAALGMNRLSM